MNRNALKNQMPRKFCCVFLLLCLAVTLFGQSAPKPLGQPVTHDNWQFVVIGDSQTPTGRYATVEPPTLGPVFVRLIDLINAASPDLIVNTGDIVDGHCSKDLLMREWREFEKGAARLKSPMYLTVGNHDIWTHDSQKVFINKFGREYYSFDHKGVHFVVLSTEVPGHTNYIAGAQLDWLRDDLARHSRGKITYVFLHQPVRLYGGKAGQLAERPAQEGLYSAWMKNVHPMLKGSKVDAVFSGHWHAYCEAQIDGVRYVTSGGAGGPIGGANAPEYKGRFHHYLIVTVRDGQTHIAVARLDGVYGPDVVTPQVRKKAQEFVEQLAFAKIPASSGSRGVPRSARCLVRNPFEQDVTGQLQFGTPIGSDWTIQPRRLDVSIPAGEQISHSIQIAYNGQDDTENPDHFKARCILSLKVGKRTLCNEEVVLMNASP